MQKSFGYFFPSSSYLFLSMIGMVWFCIRVIHRRKMNTLWSDQDRFRPKEFLKGLVFSVLLFFISDFIVSYNQPGYLTWVFNAEKFWVFLPFVLVFVPIYDRNGLVLHPGYSSQKNEYVVE